MTPSEFTVRYSEALVRMAANRFWLRALGWRFGLALLALGAFEAYQLSQGDRSWRVGLYGTIVGLGVVIAIAGWFAQRHRALQAFRDLEEGQAVFTVDDQRLKVRSKRGSADLPWKLVREVWRYPEFWLLVFSKNSFSTLPVTGVPPAALTTLEEGVRRAGGREQPRRSLTE